MQMFLVLKLYQALYLIVLVCSIFGGIHTTAERRARWGGDAIADGFIRLSAGCEDTQDLLDDIAQALSVL